MALLEVAGTLSGAVVEDTQLFAYGAAFVTGATGSFFSRQYAGLYGTLSVASSGDWYYTLDNTSAAVQGLAANAQTHEYFAISWSPEPLQGFIDIVISGVNDAASFNGDLSKTLNATAAAAVTGQLNVQDPDVGEKELQPMTNVAGAVGVFSIDKSGLWQYTLLPGQQTAINDQGKSLVETFVVATTDGSVSQVSVLVTTNEAVAPVATGFSPADEATNVAIGANLVVTFSEAIQRGSGDIVLKTAGGSTVATFAAASSANLSISGNTLTVNPTADLALGTGYRLEFAAGSIKDLAGNAYAGTTVYNFVTELTASQTGTPGDDTFTNGAGNDTFDGAAGIDKVVYSDNLASYTVTKTAGGYSVHDKVGHGTDSVANVEALWFADKNINLTVQARAAGASGADVERLAELYVAFFNRVPDADGMAFWIGQLSAGQPLDQIADIFYNAGVQYSNLTGFSANMSHGDFVNVVYRNVLGRVDGADPGGLAHWSGLLESGAASRGTLVSTILTSAHSFKGDPTWGWVPDLLDNKLAVANTFAIQWGLNYNTPSESISQGMAIAAAVTPAATDVALSLIGVTSGDLQLV